MAGDYFGQPFLEVQVPREGSTVAAGERIDRASGMSLAERMDLEMQFTVAELLRNGVTTFVEFGGRPEVQRALLPHVAQLGTRAYLAGTVESGSWASDATGRPVWKWDHARRAARRRSRRVLIRPGSTACTREG